MAPDRSEMREFLMRACHDLRSHLRAVRANSELLLRKPEMRQDAEFEQVLEYVVTGAADAGSLVDSISGYAAALDIRPNPAPISSGAMLRVAIAKLEKQISAANAKITYGDLPKVPADPDRLMQLFECVLRNALENSGDVAPCIEVTAREQGDQWLFAVHDNGVGIEEEDLERVFRPFERKDRSHAGLGLTACREIANGHGGRIWAESAPGAGTTIYFTLNAG
jgi:light-regulated signal transduction histidine kinase (bacteriophytochrome)